MQPLQLGCMPGLDLGERLGMRLGQPRLDGGLRLAHGRLDAAAQLLLGQHPHGPRRRLLNDRLRRPQRRRRRTEIGQHVG